MVEIRSQVLRVGGVAKTVVTPIVADDETGGFVRELRLLDADGVPLLIVRAVAPAAAGIAVTIPQETQI